MSEFLGIDIITLDNGGFQFYQTRLNHKVLEVTGLDSCNGLQATTMVDATLVADENLFEDKRCEQYIYIYHRDYFVSVNKEKYQISHFIFISVHCLLINPRYYTRLLCREYVGISKGPRTRLWCLIHPRKHMWIVMGM